MRGGSKYLTGRKFSGRNTQRSSAERANHLRGNVERRDCRDATTRESEARQSLCPTAFETCLWFHLLVFPRLFTALRSAASRALAARFMRLVQIGCLRVVLVTLGAVASISSVAAAQGVKSFPSASSKNAFPLFQAASVNDPPQIDPLPDRVTNEESTLSFVVSACRARAQ